MFTEAAIEITPAGPVIPSRRQRGRLAVRWLDPHTAVIAGEGEIDAASVDLLTDGVEGALPRARRLVLDLSRLEFFGVEGFSALTTVRQRCEAQGVRWVLVAGPAVARVLRICDLDATFVTEGTVGAAAARIYGKTRPALWLVAR